MVNNKPLQQHVLQQSWPPFLDLLKQDWREAGRQFADFAYRALNVCPPRILASFSDDDRNDIIQEIILHFIEDRCRVLKLYVDTGRPFVAWFNTVAYRKAIDAVRERPRGRTDDDVLANHPNPSSGTERVTSARETLAAVNKCLSRMSAKCQIMIKAVAEGYSYPEIAVLIGLRPSENKKVGNDLRWCRQRLKALLAAEGLSESDWTPE